MTEFLASIHGVGTKLFLDTEDLVQLGQTLRTGRSTSLDLSRTETDGNIGDGDILGFTRAVRDHDSPAASIGVLGGLDRFGKATDLVDLEQKSVARLQLNGLLDAQRVSHGKIITN